MRVIGVVDLLGGRAVHARAGQRDKYDPVRSVAGSDIPPGDAVALARIYLERLRIRELYLADLDAILGRPSNDALTASIAALGAPLWLDAGSTSVDSARRALDLGPSGLVVGLETLPSFQALDEICSTLGGERVAFSLDLRNGVPIVAPGASQISTDASAPEIAARAAASHAGAIIVIDLARVGTGGGIDVAQLARVRKAAPELTLLAGGGVGQPDDLRRLADAGCDGALVATSLHDGRLGADDVEAAGRYRPGARSQGIVRR